MYWTDDPPTMTRYMYHGNNSQALCFLPTTALSSKDSRLTSRRQKRVEYGKGGHRIIEVASALSKNASGMGMVSFQNDTEETDMTNTFLLDHRRAKRPSRSHLEGANHGHMIV